MRLLAATLAPSWDTQSPRLRAGCSLEGESKAGLVIACLTGPFKWLTSFLCGCLCCSLICRWVNCSLPHLAVLLWARRELAGVLLFVCSREAVCIHLPWEGAGSAASVPLLEPGVCFWKHVPWHCCHKQGWCPSPAP